jgi:hypothetical protein
VDGAAGTSQQRVEVEDIAEVLKNSRRRCDPLKLLISVQGTLFPRFTLRKRGRERKLFVLHSSLKLQILSPS